MKKFILITVLALALSLGVAAVGQAKSVFQSDDQSRVDKDETVDGSFFAAGETVTIRGTVDGDVYCAANNVDITGTVKGDILCAGQNVTLDGTVEGNVRLAAQNISVAGDVTGSATLMGMSVMTDKTFIAQRDVVVTAASATLDGTMSRDLIVAGSLVNIQGSVERETTAASESVRLGSDAKLGSLTYVSEAEQAFSKDQVRGKVTHQTPKQADYNRAIGPVETIFMLIAFAALMTLLYPLIIPHVARTINRISGEGVFYSALVGIAALVVLPIVAILLMVTLIGLPVGVILMMALAIAVLIGFAQGAVFVGGLLLGRTTPNILTQTLGGGLLLAILAQIPVFGLLVLLAWAVVGTGMVVRAAAQTLFKKPRYTDPVVKKAG